MESLNNGKCNQLENSYFCGYINNDISNFQTVTTDNNMFAEQVISLEHYTSFPIYRTNDIDTSLFRCHRCLELSLNILRVQENIMVYFVFTVKPNNVAASSNFGFQVSA